MQINKKFEQRNPELTNPGNDMEPSTDKHIEWNGKDWNAIEIDNVQKQISRLDKYIHSEGFLKLFPYKQNLLKTKLDVLNTLNDVLCMIYEAFKKKESQ